MRALPLVAAALLAAGCGASVPPRELVDARTALAQAKRSPASELAPADLHTAEVALDRAEGAFEDGQEEPTQALAYVALRKAQLAESRGRMLAAQRDEAAARRTIERLQDRMNQQTRSQLDRTRAELERRQRELAVRGEQIAQGQRELASERAARLEAERRAQAAMESLQQIAQVREEQRGLVITLSGSVLFASGESALLPIAQQRLDQVAQTIIDNGGTSIIVEGHTDSRGSRRQNAELSLARAESVRTYLVSKGVPSANIRAVGVGPDRPVADNTSADGRANNRRVEIIVEPNRR